MHITAQPNILSHYQQVQTTGAGQTNAIGQNTTQPASINGANAAQSQAPTKPLVSNEVQNVLLGLQETEETSTSFSVNTDKGTTDIDLDEYFSDTPKTSEYRFLGDDLPPLLLPSAENIAAISEHASARFKQLLTDYNIPSGPKEITYNSEGKMQLPADYPYAAELKEALKENPGLDRELSTLNAISSHYVEMQKLVPFHEEYAAAQSQAEADRILAKYSYLFHDNGNYSNIALTFSEAGGLGISADGMPVKLA